MGLDIALGAVVLLWAIRGWFKGFVLQAIGLVGLVGAILGATHVREWGRPYIQPYLPSIQPVILDRLLWWGSAVMVMSLVGGLGGWLFRLSRRRTYGLPSPNRADQGAGFVLGAGKGMILASFLVAGMETYLPAQIRTNLFVEEQSKDSKALAWEQQYHPATKMWELPPVQMIVSTVRKQGLGQDPELKDTPATGTDPSALVNSQNSLLKEASSQAEETVKTASRSLGLNIPVTPDALQEVSKTLQQIDQGMRELGLETPNSR